MNQFFGGLFYHSTSQACVTDLVPPTFSGIATLIANSNGSLTATWLAASDPTLPIRYEVFVQKNTATGLFGSANKVMITENLQAVLFTEADGSLLETGTYFVGVRALDGTGNQDSNLVSLSAVSVGVLDGSVLTLAQAVNAALGVGVCAVGGVLDEDEDEPLGIVNTDPVIGVIEDC